jgi:H+/Cl- antiporter ClcA
MTFTAIKATFLGFIYGTFFAASAYLMAVGYVAHGEKNLALTLHQENNQSIWCANDPIHKISIFNISSLIGRAPTIIIEKKPPWLIIATCFSLGIIIGLLTYRRHKHKNPAIKTPPDPAHDVVQTP